MLTFFKDNTHYNTNRHENCAFFPSNLFPKWIKFEDKEILAFFNFCTWTLQCTWFYQWKFACPKVLETHFRSYVLFQICFKSTLTMERSIIGLSSSTINMMGLFKKASLVKFCIILVKKYLKIITNKGFQWNHWSHSSLKCEWQYWNLNKITICHQKNMQMKHVHLNLNSWTLKV
jgi:hypothetical protein